MEDTQNLRIKLRDTIYQIVCAHALKYGAANLRPVPEANIKQSLIEKNLFGE
jgi:hypothetical protein